MPLCCYFTLFRSSSLFRKLANVKPWPFTTLLEVVTISEFLLLLSVKTYSFSLMESNLFIVSDFYEFSFLGVMRLILIIFSLFSSLLQLVYNDIAESCSLFLLRKLIKCAINDYNLTSKTVQPSKSLDSNFNKANLSIFNPKRIR